MTLSLFAAVVAGYLLGALPFGYLVARAYGVNIFEVGSRNPGATNVRRVLGRRAGNLVFVLDATKGMVAAALPWVWQGLGWFSASPATVGEGGGATAATIFEQALPACVAGLAGALLGHSFSCFTRFRGGKGVATASGGLLVLMPVGTLIAVAIWIVTFYAFRYVSLASVLAALSLPLTAWSAGRPSLVIATAAMVGVFVVVRHRSNIARLLAGTEARFTRDKPAGGSS